MWCVLLWWCVLAATATHQHIAALEFSAMGMVKATCVLAVLVAMASLAASTNTPHILFLLIDDLGWNGLHVVWGRMWMLMRDRCVVPRSRVRHAHHRCAGAVWHLA
jgi:hypothetical protein